MPQVLHTFCRFSDAPLSKGPCGKNATTLMCLQCIQISCLYVCQMYPFHGCRCSHVKPNNVWHVWGCVWFTGILRKFHWYAYRIAWINQESSKFIFVNKHNIHKRIKYIKTTLIDRFNLISMWKLFLAPKLK